jgi:hypothetical protein
MVLCKIKLCSAMKQKYGEAEDPRSESISTIGENGTKHLVRTFLAHTQNVISY